MYSCWLVQTGLTVLRRELCFLVNFKAVNDTLGIYHSLILDSTKDSTWSLSVNKEASQSHEQT